MDEKVMSGDREELQCPECGAPQNELDDVDKDCQSLEWECSTCDIRFKIRVTTTYEVIDIKSR